MREQRGLTEETLSIDCSTYAELYEHLRQKHNFSLPAEMIQVAVNDRFAKMQDPISPHDHVVFLPPVAGG